MMDLIAYCDGTNDLLKIAELIRYPMWELYDLVNSLLSNGILIECPADNKI